LNQDYTEKDEEDELKVFYFILFIFFSVILVQKQNEQLLNEELIFREFLNPKNWVKMRSQKKIQIAFSLEKMYKKYN